MVKYNCSRKRLQAVKATKNSIYERRGSYMISGTLHYVGVVLLAPVGQH